MHEQDLIFVSLAAYRDPQLVPTVEDCLRKASFPARLRLGICWQHGDEDLPPHLWTDPRLRILDVPWQNSRGACWARAEVMRLWQGESWFLQMDSHCRLRPGWDELLIATAHALDPTQDPPRVVLSTYATPFVPGPEEVLEEQPLQMAFQGFTPEGIPHMKPLGIPRWEEMVRPRRARFLSAGFLFAPGTFVQEVPYDPGLYFLGEEIAMTVRAYTSGYDLFHPQHTVVWHDYVRDGGIKHWEDHTEEKQAVSVWNRHDLEAKARVSRLLAGEPLDAFNLGARRTLADYEAYAGLSLRARRVQDYTVRAEEPPNPPAEPGWADEVHSWMVRFAVRREELGAEIAESLRLLYLGVHDEHGNEIYRRDMTPAEIAALPTEAPEIVFICELLSGTVPDAWTVWPVTRSGEWGKRLHGKLGPDDFAIVAEPEDLPSQHEQTSRLSS